MNNIYMILNAREIAGVEKRFLQLFNYLSNRENKFRYILFINRNIFKKTKIEINQSDNVLCIKFGIASNYNLKLFMIIDYLSLLYKILLIKIRFKPDVVHLINALSLKHAYLFDNKMIVTSFYNGGTTLTSIKNSTYQKVFKKGYYLDCLSSDIKEKILFENPNPPSKNKVFASPCSFIDYSSTDYSYRNKKDIITFAGRLNEQKGVNILMNSLIPILESSDGFKIRIYGSGPLKEELISYIKLNDIENLVTIGYVNDLKSILRESKIFLSLQKNENYPSQSLIEAMACGNAIVATNEGLTSDLVKNEFGKLIKRNHLDLTNAVISLVNKESEIEKMGALAREFVMRFHTLEKFNNYLDSLYRTIISDNI